MDTEDKQAWCEHGLKLEKEFIRKRRFRNASFKMNPEKGDDVYACDLKVGLPSDLKTCSTPWRDSMEMFGICSRHAVSVNLKDIHRYRKLYPTIIIIFDVKYPDYQATHYTDIWRIIRMIKAGVAHKHKYKKRINDIEGNAKVSFVFDVTGLPLLE